MKKHLTPWSVKSRQIPSKGGGTFETLQTAMDANEVGLFSNLRGTKLNVIPHAVDCVNLLEGVDMTLVDSTEEEPPDAAHHARCLYKLVRRFPLVIRGHILAIMLEDEARLYGRHKGDDDAAHHLLRAAAARIEQSLQPPPPVTEEEREAMQKAADEAMKRFTRGDL